MAVVNHFTPPKTESGNRTIKLTNSAIEALKEQMALTRMGRQIKVDAHLREFGRIQKDDCTFVFSPHLSARSGKGGEWYSPGAFSGTWNFALKKAGIRHRKAYETRLTFACWALSAGANPNFVANQMGTHLFADGVQRLRKVDERKQQQSDGYFERRIYG